jgi:GNAT superfamily N-acetyltransferase
MAADLKIRPASEADVPAILTLIRALAEYEKASPGAVPVTEDLLRESLFGPSPAVEGLVALWSGEIAGYALFFHNFSSWRGRKGLYLEDLFVVPEKRGHGIGKALLRAVARIAVERGCARMEWLVLDWNHPAMGFYESLGAVPLEEWTTFRLQGQSLRKLAEG